MEYPVAQDAVQFSVTRIGSDTFRIIAQNETRILSTWVIEKKNLLKRLEVEIEHLKVLTKELE